MKSVSRALEAAHRTVALELHQQGHAARHAREHALQVLAAAVVFGTAGWFFFYATFALWIRRNDAFNTVTSIFYFACLRHHPLELVERRATRDRAAADRIRMRPGAHSHTGRKPPLAPFQQPAGCT